MRILNLDNHSQSLYKADLEPQPDANTEDVLGTPKSLFGPTSLVGMELSIGKPQSWSLVELYKLDNQPLPPMIAHDAQTCDFCLVQEYSQKSWGKDKMGQNEEKGEAK